MKQRNYQLEYARRIARGLSKGLSKSQARGHPRSGESFVRLAKKGPVYDKQLESAISLMRDGKSMTKAASSVGVSAERVRNYIVSQGLAVKSSGRWHLGKDSRTRTMMIFSRGRAVAVNVRGFEQARLIGQYASDVGQFLATNDTSYLDYFKGLSVTDTGGRTYLLETDPNTLYRLASGAGDDFSRIYRIQL